MHMVTFYKRKAAFISEDLTLHLSDFFLRSASAYHRDDTLSLEILLQAEGTFQWESCEINDATLTVSHPRIVKKETMKNWSRARTRWKWHFSNASRATGSIWPSWTFWTLKKQSPPDIKMQNHIFMLAIYPLLNWVTKQMRESWTEPAAWLCVWMRFFTPQKWDGYLGTDREIIWEGGTQYNDIAFL